MLGPGRFAGMPILLGLRACLRSSFPLRSFVFDAGVSSRKPAEGGGGGGPEAARRPGGLRCYLTSELDDGAGAGDSAGPHSRGHQHAAPIAVRFGYWVCRV